MYGGKFMRHLLYAGSYRQSAQFGATAMMQATGLGVAMQPATAAAQAIFLNALQPCGVSPAASSSKWRALTAADPRSATGNEIGICICHLWKITLNLGRHIGASPASAERAFSNAVTSG
jgi:hypothetical protein